MRITIQPSYEHLRDFITRLPQTFGQQGEILYQGRNCVKRFVENGQVIIVKRYKRPHLIQRIAYTWFRPSKARRAYDFALRLEEMQIATPAPIAYIEKKQGGLFCDSYFVSAYCPDPTLFPELVEKPDFDLDLAHALAAEVAKWHEKGFLHGDLNLANILYRTSPDGQYAFTVIDINRSHFIPQPSKDQCFTNLMRLTHRIDLLRQLTEYYARQRGWEPQQCCDSVEAKLHAFELRREKKKKLKRTVRL